MLRTLLRLSDGWHEKESMADMCCDGRLYNKEISAEERKKHLAYVQVEEVWGFSKGLQRFQLNHC